MVERSAVNRLVVGSNPTAGAIFLSVADAWDAARAQISTHGFDTLKSEALEILKLWVFLPAPLRAAVLAIVRSTTPTG